MSKQIPLSQGKFAAVDDADYDWLAKHKWTYDYKGYAMRRSANVTIYMHRVVLNASGPVMVDHVNGDGLDNRRENLRIVIFGSGQFNPRYPKQPPVPRTVLINPVLTPLGPEEESDWEGCLSVPGMRGVVPRWSRIRYTGFDQYGDPIDRNADGFHARVVQHECDHLWGKLYPMRMTDMTKFGFTEVLFPDIAADEDD